MHNANYIYDFDDDISRTMYDKFIDALNAQFYNIGPLIIFAPKDGGELFEDTEFTHQMGDFVFTSIICDGCGVDIIRGYVVGEYEQIFDLVGGLNFDFEITSQGRTRYRFIDAERQIRDFATWYGGDDVNEDAYRQVETLWEKSKLK